MNERIKELSAQAWKYANETVGYREFGYHDAFEQKFAELLAKELANHIAGQLPNERLDDWHEGYHAGVQRSIDCLKELGVQ
jgi:hypothetical protein